MSFRAGGVTAGGVFGAAPQSQAVANLDNSNAEEASVRRHEVEAFLGVPLPEDDLLSAGEALRFLRQIDMEDLILERAPFFFIESAVAIGQHTVLGVARMTAERSAGHFPGKPIVPLIELCKAIAQTGIVLVSLQARSHEAPIAIGSGESKALAKELVVAPVDLLVRVHLQGSRLGLHIVEGCAFIGGEKIGTLAKIVYTLIPKDQLMA